MRPFTATTTCKPPTERKHTMYQLDTQAARHADTAGATIKEIGKYVGEFLQAQDIKTKKGGRGVSFIFKSAGGQKANLAIYTTGASGERYQGYDALMAIMTCMQLRGIKPAPGKVTRYDFDTKKEVVEDGTVPRSAQAHRRAAGNRGLRKAGRKHGHAHGAQERVPARYRADGKRNPGQENAARNACQDGRGVAPPAAQRCAPSSAARRGQRWRAACRTPCILGFR